MKKVTLAANTKIAFISTTHCLIGCGLGDVIGVILATLGSLSYITRIFVGDAFGLLLGFIFAITPLLKNNFTFQNATKIIITTETLSIFTMIAAESATELVFPGFRRMGLLHIQYWIGLVSALCVGFIIAYPVNYLLVKKGIRHIHS